MLLPIDFLVLLVTAISTVFMGWTKFRGEQRRYETERARARKDIKEIRQETHRLQEQTQQGLDRLQARYEGKEVPISPLGSHNYIGYNIRDAMADPSNTLNHERVVEDMFDD